jgi:hypothetical protein
MCTWLDNVGLQQAPPVKSLQVAPRGSVQRMVLGEAAQQLPPGFLQAPPAELRFT